MIILLRKPKVNQTNSSLWGSNMSLVTKTIDSRILGKEMNLAVYRPAVNDNSALPVQEILKLLWDIDICTCEKCGGSMRSVNTYIHLRC